jgi:sugar phosphate permease
LIFFRGSSNTSNEPKIQKDETESTRPLKLFLIFFILSLLYIFSQFYRVSNAVIAPNLIRDLGLNAETLGILGGAYFYSFALLQRKKK